MKHIPILLAVCLLTFFGMYSFNKIQAEKSAWSNLTQPKLTLVSQAYDDRGYVSFRYTYGVDTFAADYCTEDEMDSLFGIHYVPLFRIGQILLPDYACPDTLIVTDASGLNRGMAYIEQGILDATDYQIDSVLHSFCAIYYADHGLQPINFEQAR